jgi:hypothetical protein
VAVANIVNADDGGLASNGLRAFRRFSIAINEEGWALLRNDDLQSSSSAHP